MRQAICLLGLLVAVTGCEVRTPGTVNDGGGGDGSVPSAGCTPGSPGFYCAGHEAVECRADGSEGTRTDCTSSGQVCAPDIGCATCVPNTFRCNGNNVETCNFTGTGWDEIAVCDAAAGQMCSASLGICRDACSDAAASNSYLGCEYWPTTTMNSELDDRFLPAVVVANPQTVPVDVTVTGPNGFHQTRTIAPGGTETIELAWVPELKQAFNTEKSALVRDGAYRLVSTYPVTVYQFNPLEYAQGSEFSYTNDASLLLPTHVLTGNYIVLSWPTRKSENFLGGSYAPGFFAVVGVSETPVEVNIDFRGYVLASSDNQVQNFAPGQSGTFTLNQGDVLQIAAAAPSDCTRPSGVSAPYCLVGDDYDLSGSEIRASGPVQVIGGHNCAFIPFDRHACDHLEEVLFPLESWGTETIVSLTQAPMGRTEPNVIRIISGADGNTISFDPPSVGGGSVTLNRGEIAEFEANQSFQAKGTGAFLLGQFVVGQNYLPSTPNNAQGDPSFSLGIPSEQFRTSYAFLAPTSYPTNFVNVTAPAGATVTLDGSPVSGFEPVGASGFQVARVPIAGGQHAIESAQPFGIVVYGFGSFTSYMYPGGLDFEVINIF